MIYDIEKYFITSEQTIEDAMSLLNDTRLKMVLVVDEDKKLLATLSDGDIRRALLKNETLNSPISVAMNTSPTFGKVDGSLHELSTDMRHKNLSYAPIVDAHHHPHALYQAEHQKFSRLSPVLLMVGGEGRRLRPLTENCPKPMLNIGGLPILERSLIELIEQGFSDFYFSVKYLADHITEYFGDGSKFGVSIRYIYEKQPSGTAGALRLFDLSPDLNSPLLVLNGDLITTLNFGNMIEHHRAESAAITTCVVQRNQQIAYGVVEHENGLIKGISEKPSIPVDINAGVYCISPEYIQNIQGEGYLDMPDFLTDLIQGGEKCCVYRMNNEFWLDIGSPEELKRAESIYGKSDMIHFQIFAGN